MTSTELLVTSENAVGVLTLNRPEKRNALSGELVSALADAIVRFDAADDIRVMILTGTDPAFSAGFDLRNLGAELAATRTLATPRPAQSYGLLPAHDTPIIGAVNGPAVTGGLEVALGCDFLVASSRASFADTHGRVGVMPGGGMTIRLPALIGVDRARRMSLTGEFVHADTALAWGLVTEVIDHEHLMTRTMEIANAIASLDPAPVSELRHMYDEIGALAGSEAWERERRWNRQWMTERFDAASLADRANGIIARGSTQA
jgi:enoyl-CoA hydratase